MKYLARPVALFFVCLLGLPPASALAFENEPDAGQTSPTLALTQLKKDKHEAIGQVILKGTEPQFIFIPILHDGPYNHIASTDLSNVETVLSNCKIISDYLYERYGVRNVMLEGYGKVVSDQYNKPENASKKLTPGKTKMRVFHYWVEILNSKRWHMVPAFDKKIYGPMTQAGMVYDQKINQALRQAQQNGWFQTQQKFLDNQTEMLKPIQEACKEYNAKRKQILEEDPGLNREYELTVSKRNKAFLDNTADAEGPGIILCGSAHYQDLVKQLNDRDASYAIIVPKGLDWPPTEKDAVTIFKDMSKLGASLKQVTLKFGDGGSAKLEFPVDE